MVDNARDRIIEFSSEGSDNVRTSVSYTLAGSVSVETLQTNNKTATTGINLTGNAIANVVTGNNGVNIINGGAGKDGLTGALGKDTSSSTPLRMPQQM